MYDPTYTASTVSTWTGLGVTLPADLIKAIKAFDAVQYVKIVSTPEIDVETLTADNAEQTIRTLADQLVLSTVVDTGADRLSALERAKIKVQDAAARAVLGLAREAIPDVIEQLTPRFEQQAQAYAEAVSQLPDQITSETLIGGGATVVTAYGNAQSAASYLNQVSSWVRSTGSLTGYLPKTSEKTIRILRPENGLQLAKLEEAEQLKADNALAALNPVLVAAVKLSVPFGINTLAECDQIRHRLRLRPQALQA